MSCRYEGLPMVLIEAMSCGLPIVAFDCECGPRELIENGSNGFLIKPFDIKAMAERINELIENELLRYQMGTKAAMKVKTFSKEPIMQQWVNLFDDLVREKISR